MTNITNTYKDTTWIKRLETVQYIVAYYMHNIAKQTYTHAHRYIAITYAHIHIPTYVHIDMHTYIHTYMHTYMHTYIHT
jgi:hypothetical protein